MRSSRMTQLLQISAAMTLTATFPSAAQSQSLEAISELEIGLVGLTVDIEDGQFLGRGCYWNGSGRCAITTTTLSDAGVPVLSAENLSLREGLFGPERYRLAGRITSLSFDGTTSSVFTRGHTVESPQEVLIGTDGSVVARPRPRSNNIWGQNSVRMSQVRAHVTWQLFDAEASDVVITRQVKGMGTDLGNAIYNSLERFVDHASDELGDAQ